MGVCIGSVPVYHFESVHFLAKTACVYVGGSYAMGVCIGSVPVSNLL